MARPSLADSLRASLEKGVHIDTAKKIARGLDVIPNDDVPSPPLAIVPPINKITSISPIDTAPENHVQPIISANTPLDGLIVSPLDRETVKPLDGKTVAQLNSDTVKPLGGDTVTPYNPQTVSQYKTHPQTPIYYVPLSVLNLAYNQACILEFLIANVSGVTNARAISDQTHIGIPSVREAIGRLIVKGFMLKPVTIKSAAFQGFSYVLNKALCDHFINAGGLGQDIYGHHETIHETVSPSEGITVTPSDGLTIHSSSKSLEDLKPTTTPYPQTVSPSDSHTLIPSHSDTIRPSEGFILTGTVGMYWEGEGLGEGQALKWCQQFEVEPGQMRQQLEWARFDLELNARRSEVKKDTVSWFFGHLRTTGGCFPKPVNYKSPTEIRAEAMEQELLREREAKERLETAQVEQKFQRILADPDGFQYQGLYAAVSAFAKETGGDTLINALRDIFRR